MPLVPKTCHCFTDCDRVLILLADLFLFRWHVALERRIIAKKVHAHVDNFFMLNFQAAPAKSANGQ